MPFTGNHSIENTTVQTLSIEVVEGVELVPVLEPTALRTNPIYSIYFNWFRFIAIGIIPFCLLVSYSWYLQPIYYFPLYRYIQD